MKKLLGGGLALAFTAAGMGFLLSGPASADHWPLRTATLSAAEVPAGGTISVTGDACEKGTAVWTLFLESDIPGETETFLSDETNAASGLSFTVTLPADLAPGNYLFQISCGPFPEPTDEDPDLYAGPDGNTDIFFTVVAAAPTTTEPAPEAPPPAPAVSGTPRFTG